MKDKIINLVLSITVFCIVWAIIANIVGIRAEEAFMWTLIIDMLVTIKRNVSK